MVRRPVGAFSATLHPFETGARLLAQLDYGRSGGYGEIQILDGLQLYGNQWTVADAPVPPWMTGFVIPAGAGNAQWFMNKLETSAAYNATAAGGRSSWYTLQRDDDHRRLALAPERSACRTRRRSSSACSPPAQAALLPGQNDIVNGNATLLLIPSITTGYDGVRALPEKDWSNPTDAVISGDLPRVITSAY